MPTLTLDIRESKKTIRAFRTYVSEKWPEWEVDVREIDVGDFAVEDKLGIEHKTPGDFVSSLNGNKLFQQAEELKRSYEKACIVVDGIPRNLWENPYVPMTSDNVFGILSSLFMRRGVPVLFTGKRENLLVSQVMKLAEKTEGDGSFVYNPIRQQASKKELRLHLIASLRGVGPKRARGIIDFYGSPLEALKQYERWKDDIPGIGEATVQRAKEVLEDAVD